MPVVVRIQPPQQRRLRHKLRRRMQTLLLCFLVCAGGLYWVSLPPAEREQADRPHPVPVEIQSGKLIRVYHVETATLQEMDLEQYLIGVVAAEMPAGFDEEALKAQAVAARTFAVSRMEHPNTKVTALHPDAQITTSPEICQAWISDEEQKNRWGNHYDTYHNKIAEVVQATAGQVLTYEDQLIEPLYHASCGGQSTEDVKNVWGNAVPYLVSVPCQHGMDKHTQEESVFTLAEFSQKVGLDADSIPAGSFQDYIQILSSTAANRVREIRIGDTVLTGAKLRNALGLKSTLFTYDISDGKISFRTNGYGHGVGMCQYGADYYAQQGYDYQEILSHYYPGTKLQKE